MIQIENIKAKISPLREELIHHPMYKNIQELNDIKTFMEFHIFAVWDFMSLLKSLQNSLTCVSVPWVPVGSANTRFFINEIVVGEESDVDSEGNRTSHFELYLKAMDEIGADTKTITKFVDLIKEGKTVNQAFDSIEVADEIKAFVLKTFEIINSGKSYIQASVFTFGREDLIPDMFISIVQDLSKNFPEELKTLKYYLERHIEVDSGEHNPLAMQMTRELCGTDPEKWQEVEKQVIESLEARINLWDGIGKKIGALSKV